MSRLVVAPDTVIRFKNGQVCIGTGSRPQSRLFDDMGVLVLLCRFARPRPIAELLPNENRWIRQLAEIGVLVEATKCEATPSDDWEQSQVHLASLARLAHLLAGDVAAFGPAGSERLARTTGVSLVHRLEGALAGLEALHSELRSLRDEHLAQQIGALKVDRDATGLRLHLGCGSAALPGWINIDFHPAPLAWNLSWGLPFADGSAEYVYLAHTLEHFYYPDECLRLLSDLRRVLAPEGVLRIVVPDIEKCLRAYVEEDEVFFASRRQHWPWWPAGVTRLEDFLAYAGAAPGPDAFDAHKYGYDYLTLQRLLQRAGFRTVSRSEYQQSSHAALRIDDASQVAGARFGEQYYSLFVEASA